MGIINAITTYFSGFWGVVELLGTISSLICVYLAAKHNQWTWIFGAIGVLLFGLLFYEYKLYSDAGLQILFFLPVQLWGFLKWRDMAAQADNKTVTLSMSETAISLTFMSIAVLTILNGYVMAERTDASFPYADAWTTWMSVFAQILMIRKYWQSWVLWAVMDVAAIYIYYAKELYVVSGLYVIFLIIATMGIFAWRRDWKATIPLTS